MIDIKCFCNLYYKYFMNYLFYYTDLYVNIIIAIFNFNNKMKDLISKNMI